jgi:hypothetical protein
VTGPEGESRAGEALEHLQAAARELIAAARTFLDLAEDVVDDPKQGEALLQNLGRLARPRRSSNGPPEDGGVEHIDID